VTTFSAYRDPLFLLVIILLVATNVLWYRIKFLLRDRGYPISYIHHFQDLTHLNQLIATSPPDSARLRLLRLTAYVGTVATLGAFAWFVFGRTHHA
jgi:hypothetical protein